MKVIDPSLFKSKTDFDISGYMTTYHIYDNVDSYGNYLICTLLRTIPESCPHLANGLVPCAFKASEERMYKFIHLGNSRKHNQHTIFVLRGKPTLMMGVDKYNRNKKMAVFYCTNPLAFNSDVSFINCNIIGHIPSNHKQSSFIGFLKSSNYGDMFASTQDIERNSSKPISAKIYLENCITADKGHKHYSKSTLLTLYVEYITFMYINQLTTSNLKFGCQIISIDNLIRYIHNFPDRIRIHSLFKFNNKKISLRLIEKALNILARIDAIHIIGQKNIPKKRAY